MPDIQALQRAFANPVSASSSAAQRKAPQLEKQVEEAAEQFESLLIGQMMKMARESMREGALGGEAAEAGQSMIDFAAEHLASVIGKRGLGLKPLLVQGFLAREAAKAEAGQAKPAALGSAAEKSAAIHPLSQEATTR